MANNPGIAGDAKLHLQGIRAYVDPERGLVFVYNEKRDEWMLCCPHCSTVYWYVLGNNLMHIPEECRNAISPPMICETCKKQISYDHPWSDHDHAAHDKAVPVG